MDTANSTTASLVAKITLSSIGAQPKSKSVEYAHPIAMIFGEASRTEIGQTTYGEFVRFRGNFAGVNLSTGEKFRAGAMILPPLIQDILAAAVDQADGPIQFGLEIGVKPSEKGNTGYEYTVRPLLEPEENDALMLLESKLTPLLSLAAPDTKPASGKKG